MMTAPGWQAVSFHRNEGQRRKAPLLRSRRSACYIYRLDSLWARGTVGVAASTSPPKLPARCSFVICSVAYACIAIANRVHHSAVPPVACTYTELGRAWAAARPQAQAPKFPISDPQPPSAVRKNPPLSLENPYRIPTRASHALIGRSASTVLAGAQAFLAAQPSPQVPRALSSYE
ncbi:hypothetical protein K458DRAFT_77104 [Lentithecium fluviatile CBS 122367]|uniref:Uncharacterized protein n=1 Tax=Lentithecium fluviatile CBS 122367 TaxID=1168545 RepID=A0A6G1IUT9_9PLEO|nr:hypothetical protein K458DRAFT_77104 [Lentithecium fluviatile CBS 122367]